MITLTKTDKKRYVGEDEYDVVEIRGLSTDTKPTEFEGDVHTVIDNGSVFIEIDTQKIFFYDLDSETWKGTE